MSNTFVMLFTSEFITMITLIEMNTNLIDDLLDKNHDKNVFGILMNLI